MVMENDEISNKKSCLKIENNPESIEIKTVDGTATIICDGIKRKMTVDFSVMEDPTAKMSRVLSVPSENSSTTSSQLQWQDKVVLFTPLLEHQMILPEFSNCLAVQAFLKMCNLGYEIERRSNAVAMSPTKTAPFIKIEKYVVGGFEGIIQFVNKKNITLIEKLDHEQKINLKAFISLVMNRLNLIELYMCWRHKETYENVTRKKNGSVYPWPLNWIQNITKCHQVNKQLKSQDWKEKTLNEVIFELEVCCEALTQRLAGKSHFFDEGDTELDACVFGHLYSILNTPLPGDYLANTVKGYPDLIKLVNRIKKLYF